MNVKICIRSLLFLLFSTQILYSQQAAQDTTSKLKVESSETVEGFLRKGREVRKLSGNVRLRQENTLIYCDTAIIDLDDAVLKGNVVIEQGDSVKIFADSALYFGATKQSDLFGKVVLAKADKKLFTKKLHYDVGNKIATYYTGATLTNGQSQLSSKRGYYYVNEDQIYFKGNVLITDPDFTVRTDTMLFNTETQIATFVAPTLISEHESKIYCEGGFYDIENDFAEFDVNPQYERKDQRGKAQKMTWQGTSKEYILQDSAYIEEKTRIVKADVIRYNSISEVATLVGNAYYKDSTQEITGTKVRYDSRNKFYQLLGRGRVSDPPNIIEADSLDFNDQLGNGFAQGSVIWSDTSSNMSVYSYRLDYNKQTDYLSAYGGFGERGNGGFGGPMGRPMMKTLVDKDTLYLASQLLISFKPDTASDVRQLLAYKDVRIFKSDMQAVCDSLSFSSSDSIFWFYKLKSLPIVWSDTSQFSGDTIKMLLKNSKLDRIWLRLNAMVVNSEDGQLFNQIKGKFTTAFFRENEVREMYTDGNAQAVYYALDDKKAYIGVNETKCSEMRLYFGNNQVNSIKFYAAPEGTFTPMKKAGKEGKKLDGFFWEKTRRPRSIDDILRIYTPM
jgi:lipopolysaccharide export system protein LptA